MLEQPALNEQQIVDCLEQNYWLQAVQLDFLPLGADHNTVVYRVQASDGSPFFVKLRGGIFDETSVILPAWLYQNGVEQVIPAVRTMNGELWAELAPYKLILYPYIDGQDAYAASLSVVQWREFGAALRGIHNAALPPGLVQRIRREDFSPRWRQALLGCLRQDLQRVYTDPIARETTAFLGAHSAQVDALAQRAQQLADELQAQSTSFVLCHTDLHAGNLHLTPRGDLYIVDWDDPLFAPRERDLMFIGGAQGFRDTTPEQEEDLFYAGYGPYKADPKALAYYRSERILVDLAIYCQELLHATDGGADRAQALHWLKANFLPGGTIEAAYRTGEG